MLRPIFVLLLVGLPFTPVAAEDVPKSPAGCHPSIVLATTVEESGTVQLRLTVPQTVVETRMRVVERQGRSVEEEYKKLKPVYVHSTMTIDEEVKVYNRAGKPIDSKLLPKLLGKGAAVMLSVDGMVDPFYLQVLRDDVLVIVLSGDKAKTVTPLSPL